MPIDKRLDLDRVGIVCSGVCAIHCVFGPILVLLSPAISDLLGNEGVHIVLLLFIVPVAAFAFYRNGKIHKKTHPMLFGIIGIVFLLSAVIFESLFKIENLEVALTTIGCVFLIFGHIFNINCLGCHNRSEEVAEVI